MNWRAVRAMARKEFISELRGRHGLLSVGLFGLVVVVASALGMAGREWPPRVASAQLATLTLLVGVVTIPRLFLTEDDQRTADTFRVLAPPGAVFLGKFLFGALNLMLSVMVLNALFIGLTRVSADPGLLLLASLAAGFSAAVGLCASSALALGAENRWLLAGAVGLPLLLPQMFVSQQLFFAALSPTAPVSVPRNVGGLVLFAVAMLSVGIWVVEELWRLHPSNTDSEPG